MPSQASARLLILGSGQDGSSPQFGGPPVDIERTASSILVTGPSGTRYLFDASPDLRIQGIRAGFDPQSLGGVFLTHAHMGHYVGLAQFGNEAAATSGVTCFGTASMHEYLSRNEPWKSLFTRRHLEFNVVTPGVTVQLEEFMSVTAHLVPHRPDFSDTVGFVIDNLATGGSVLYLPDIDQWEAWDAATEVVDSVTLALLDASFSSRDELPGRAMGEFPHPLVGETIARFRDSPAQIVLTHINHSNPLGIVGGTSTHDAAEAGFLIARDGDEYEF